MLSRANACAGRYAHLDLMGELGLINAINVRIVYQCDLRGEARPNKCVLRRHKSIMRLDGVMNERMISCVDLGLNIYLKVFVDLDHDSILNIA